jgi:hypothetical protein
LIPYGFENINVTSADVYGYMNVYDNSVHPSCSSCFTSCKTSSDQYFSFSVTGKLVDSDGHGICNADIDVNPANYGNLEAEVTYPILAAFVPDTATVTWMLTILGGGAKTDSNGNFEATVDGMINLIASAAIPFAMDYGCYHASGPSILPFLLNISVAKTTTTTVASGSVNFYSAISKPV